MKDTGATDEPDEARLSQEIQEAVERMRRQGRTINDEADALFRLQLEAYASEADIDGVLRESLVAGEGHWNIAADYPLVSHRPPPLGWLILALKRIASPLVRLYTDHLVGRQTQLNTYYYRLLHETIRESSRLRMETAILRQRLDELEGAARSPRPDQ